MTNLYIDVPAGVKFADAAEWALCAKYGIERKKHDSSAYDKDSDVNAGDTRISVKTSAFTLMAGSLCEGRTEFSAIWELYANKVHSNVFAYVTKDSVCYMMNLDEFRKFVFTWCTTERESAKNGGGVKIRCKKESKKMKAWLAAQVAA